MEDNGKNLFRKTAIESMANPEELNKPIYYGISGSWIIIISVIGLIASFIIYSVFSFFPVYVNGAGIILNKSRLRPVMAGAKGIIIESDVNRGDIITHDKILAKIKTREDRNQKFINITSPYNGIIIQKWIYPSLYVSESDILFTVEEPDFFVHPMVILYIPSDLAGPVKPGMEAHVTIKSLENTCGFMRGKVDRISDEQTTRELMSWETGNLQTVDDIIKRSGNKKFLTSLLIILTENKDGTCQWSQKIPSFSLKTGTLCNCSIIVDKKDPFQELINHLN